MVNHTSQHLKKMLCSEIDPIKSSESLNINITLIFSMTGI